MLLWRPRYVLRNVKGIVEKVSKSWFWTICYSKRRMQMNTLEYVQCLAIACLREKKNWLFQCFFLLSMKWNEFLHICKQFWLHPQHCFIVDQDIFLENVKGIVEQFSKSWFWTMCYSKRRMQMNTLESVQLIGLLYINSTYSIASL